MAWAAKQIRRMPPPGPWVPVPAIALSRGVSAMDVAREDGLDLSVVIPVYNEEDNVAALHAQIRAALDALARPSEIVLVNDGSRDGTAAALDALAASDPGLTVVHLRRNFGQTAAMAAGFDLARGAVIVAMDGDLQNDPADISLLLAKLDEGYDVVSGWRRNRRDKWLTRLVPSRIANWLISSLTGVKLHDYGCSLKAYRREILRDVHLYGEMHRFIPALAHWAGGSVAEVAVSHRARTAGKSKYGLGRTTRVLLDLLTVKFLLSYSTKPIHVFGPPGLLAVLVGVGLGLYLTFVKLVEGYNIGHRPLLMLAVLLVLTGAQFITMGLLGEIQARTYYEATGRPPYAVRRIATSRTPQPQEAPHHHEG